MVSSSSMVDYYKELGVHRYATANDIRTAYKRLALTWHPDRNKAKEAEEKFKKIKQAYDVLIDEKQKREYDQQQQQQEQQKNAAYQTKTTNMKYTKPNQNPFNLQTFEDFITTPIDPFDILSDIQFYQDSDFTAKMMNSPSYRNLYTQLFNSMNSGLKVNHQTPIYLNNDRLFRPNPKVRVKQHVAPPPPPRPSRPPPPPPPRPSRPPPPPPPKSSSPPKYSSIPVIHSTMPHDWFLNELIDLHEQQKHFSYSSFNTDPFFNDLTHCTNCHKKISNDRVHLIQHEQQCRKTTQRYSTIPTKTVRV